MATGSSLKIIQHPKLNYKRPIGKGLLVGGFKHFLFSSLFGDMIQFDEHIFQMGWFNHQAVYCYFLWPCEEKITFLHSARAQKASQYDATQKTARKPGVSEDP